MIPGPAGDLEAILEFDPASDPRMTAIVCHPHPLFGGTMHTKAVFRAAKAAVRARIPALRFNFRGVGLSRGEHAQGIGEREDVRAALGYLERRFPGRPVCLMGFSFGAWVGLAVGSTDARVTCLVGLGVPVGASDLSYLTGVGKPKLIVQGTNDRYGPRPQVEALYAAMAEPKQINWVEGADHFFTGRLEEMQAAVQSFLVAILSKHEAGPNFTSGSHP